MEQTSGRLHYAPGIEVLASLFQEGFILWRAGAQEETVELYEIRITGADPDALTHFEQHYINDETAIRSARYFADGRSVQVWRRSLCVYAHQRAPSTNSTLGIENMGNADP
jgi:hypothetical protein